MAIDVVDAHFGGQLAVGNKDDALFAVQGKGNYGLVVFAAKECRPPEQAFVDRVAKRGVRMQYVPLLDQYALADDERFALSVNVPLIASAYRRGSRVLVTCNLGINRSAFITALVLDAVHGYGGGEALRVVRTRRVRGQPLANAFYASVLEQRPARCLVHTDCRETLALGQACAAGRRRTG